MKDDQVDEPRRMSEQKKGAGECCVSPQGQAVTPSDLERAARRLVRAADRLDDSEMCFEQEASNFNFAYVRRNEVRCEYEAAVAALRSLTKGTI